MRWHVATHGARGQDILGFDILESVHLGFLGLEKKNVWWSSKKKENIVGLLFRLGASLLNRSLDGGREYGSMTEGQRQKYSSMSDGWRK
jgi:hypothetical protein